MLPCGEGSWQGVKRAEEEPQLQAIAECASSQKAMRRRSTAPFSTVTSESASLLLIWRWLNAASMELLRLGHGLNSPED